jgi:type IV pilus assembly protein PilQ
MRSTRSTEGKREHWLKGAAIAAVASLLLLNVGHALAQAANSIENVTVSKGSSGRTIVRFTLEFAPLPNPPAGFAINNPPRIALDFPDTVNGLVARRRRSVTRRCASSMSARQAIALASSST